MLLWSIRTQSLKKHIDTHVVVLQFGHTQYPGNTIIPLCAASVEYWITRTAYDVLFLLAVCAYCIIRQASNYCVSVCVCRFLLFTFSFTHTAYDYNVVWKCCILNIFKIYLSQSFLHLMNTWTSNTILHTRYLKHHMITLLSLNFTIHPRSPTNLKISWLLHVLHVLLQQKLLWNNFLDILHPR